jgi:hypothetical protein
MPGDQIMDKLCKIVGKIILQQIAGGACADCGNNAGLARQHRNDGNFRGRRNPAGFADQRQPIAIGQAQIGNQDVGLQTGNGQSRLGQRAHAAGRSRHWRARRSRY